METKHNSTTYHVPVMLSECLDGLNINPDGVYVDVTFGGGGHARAIYEKLSSKGHLIAFDQDPDAAKNAWQASNFHFVPSNFSFLKNFLKHLGFVKVDGILADLGVSSHQFDVDKRGFSIRTEGELDMRMDQKSELTAKKIVNDYEEADLKRVFKIYGEIERPYALVNAILKARSAKKIKTTSELVEVVKFLAQKNKEHKFLAQVFQALRMEVNRELEVLESFLDQTKEVIKPNGRLVIMSYHSLEDRMVKNFLKRGNIDGSIEKDFYGNILKPFSEINRKPISPSEEEIEINNRARSAKLRIAVRDGE